VLAAAAALLLGVVNDDGPTLALSLVASVTALICSGAGRREELRPAAA